MSSGTEIDDIQLLKDAQSGDSEAFGELYERYAPRVFRYLYAHLDNRLDAEDLTEEIFLRVWKTLGSYQEQGVPFLAFLFRVARNALIDHYRRSAKGEQEESIEDIHLRDRAPEPVEAVTATLEHQRLRQVMDQLREDYRTARAVMPNVRWFHRPEHSDNRRQADELDTAIGQVSNCQVGPFITPLGSTNEQCACRYSSWHHPGGYVTKPADYTSRPTNYRIVIEGACQACQIPQHQEKWLFSVFSDIQKGEKCVIFLFMDSHSTGMTCPNHKR